MIPPGRAIHDTPLPCRFCGLLFGGAVLQHTCFLCQAQFRQLARLISMVGRQLPRRRPDWLGAVRLYLGLPHGRLVDCNLDLSTLNGVCRRPQEPFPDRRQMGLREPVQGF